MEVEIKARIKDLDSFRNKLSSIGASIISEISQEDHYFYPKNKKKSNFVLRVRSTNDKHQLVYKAFTDRDGVWDELSTSIDKPNQAIKILLNSGFREIVFIKKKREEFKLNDLEINLDQFDEPKDFGDWIEAEVITDNPKEGKDKIKELFNQLGIKDKDFVHKGYPEIILKI